jgi:hypothetical protein
LSNRLNLKWYYWAHLLEKDIFVMAFWLGRVKERCYEIHSNTSGVKVRSEFISYRINSNRELM